MRRLLACTLAAMLSSWSAVFPPHAGAAGSSPAPSPTQFLKIRAPEMPVILPDGSLLTRDWPDGIFQLYRVTPRMAAGEPSYRPGEADVAKLTSYPDGLSAFSVSPVGSHVVLMHASGGNENWQLTLMDLGAPGRPTRPVLANPKVQAAVNAWKLDGSAFVYTANDESPTDFYVYRYDLAAGKATRLLGREGSWNVRTMTRDGSRLLVHQAISASDTRCFELAASDGQMRELTLKPDGGTAASSFVGYMPGEKAVLMASDYRDGISRLYVRDLKSGAVREPLPALRTFELAGARVNDDGDLLVVETNEDGFGALRVYSLPDFKPLPMPAMERGVGGSGAFRGRTLVWQITNARTPGTSYVTTWPAGGASAQAPVTRQLTYVEDQGVDLAAFPLPELIRYPAFDGRQIPAFLYLPPGVSKGTATPFIVSYHGGPESQSRPQFSAPMQYFLSRGFGVLLPNVRGSTGYGRAFHMLDDYRLRWDSVRDGVDAAEWLVKNGYAAAGRIATYGGSYGGFMSVACVVEDQERVDRGERKERLFGACVDIVGIVNMQTFLEKTSGYRRKLREEEYGPLTDPKFLESVSSIRRADKIQVPVFIAHGFNDPRVPVEEAMQLAVALKEKGRNPRVFIAPDEGHGFAKLDNRVYFYERAANFLAETIGR